MFSPPGCRRGFPREPNSWQAGPHTYGPPEVWDRPPWKPKQRRGRGRGCLYPRPFPGHSGFPWHEEDERWAPHDWPPPPFWGNCEDSQEPEDFSGDCYPEPGPDCFYRSEFPNEEGHPPWPPPLPPREPGDFPGGAHERRGRWCRGPRRGCRGFPRGHPFPCPRPSRGKQPSSKPGLPHKSQAGVTEKLQDPDTPQTLIPSKDGAQSVEQTAQSPPEVTGKVSESPKPASTPQKSPGTDPQAASEAAEPEQAAAATLVKPGARQQPADSHNQSLSALETEAAPPEKSSAGPGEPLQVELCSQSVPKAGAGGGSHPHSPAAPPEPAKRVCTAAGSTGEVGAGLCPHSHGRQHVPSEAGEAEGEAAHSGLLSGLQPLENLQAPSEAALEPDAQPRQACSKICTTPETSPQTQHPPGSSETKPIQAQGGPWYSLQGIPGSQHRAAGSQPQLGSKHPTASPASIDLRSAAILARKQEIELSYQQFSLTIAVVATMLLQKEPSMEASLGLALRANLRQGRIHHLRELENFISSYDSASLSPQSEGTDTSISPATVWGMTEDRAGASGCL